MKIKVLKPEYVEQFPDQLEEGLLYISEEFALTAHKCCCGCGEDVYNKLSPVKWHLAKSHDGTVSLDPSIGNWKYACRSHYWIRANRVIDAGPMSARAIEAVQRRDLRDRDHYIVQVNAQGMHLWGRTRALLTRVLRHLQAVWRR